VTRRELFSLLTGPVRLALPQRRLVARVDAAACDAASGGDCRACLPSCPSGDRALRFDPGSGISIDPLVCDGCGRCVDVCSTVQRPPAISLVAATG
jgi:ferredoxin